MMKDIVIHLSKDLTSRYGIKRFPVRKGDLVRIVKGDGDKDEKLNVMGKEGKVIKVLKNEKKVVVENINISKADGKMKPRKIDPSALVITKVDLEDKRRKDRLARLASIRNKTVEEEPESSNRSEEKTEDTQNSSEDQEVKSNE
ncbi:MAG: 50S ribosomal protein L24 [Thermoplasmatales archaeon]